MIRALVIAGALLANSLLLAVAPKYVTADTNQYQDNDQGQSWWPLPPENDDEESG
jgi:hypothetical protein